MLRIKLLNTMMRALLEVPDLYQKLPRRDHASFAALMRKSNFLRLSTLMMKTTSQVLDACCHSTCQKPRCVDALHVSTRAPTPHAYRVFLFTSVLSCTNFLKRVREGHIFRKNHLLELLPIFEELSRFITLKFRIHAPVLPFVFQIMSKRIVHSREKKGPSLSS